MNYDAYEILAELARRQKLKRKVDMALEIKRASFDKQLDYIFDPSRFRSMKCTRRAGKSSGDVLDNFRIAQKYPGSRMVYGALTLDSAEEIAWDIYLEFAEKFKIDIKANKSKRSFTWPNGSRVRFFGLDASEKQMRKILGQKLRKASIDEAGSLTVNMVRVCYQMIMPALADLRPNSWLSLLGTCENIPNTFFEQVTEGREKAVAWSNHAWTAYDNPHMVKQWADEIADLKKANPNVVEASWFRTHYLNEWCTDDELRIIVYDDDNMINELPSDKKFHYILGVDLGYNDATSFTVVAFSFDDPRVYFVESFKDTKMDFTDTANQVKELEKKYELLHYIVDGANKQGVEEIKKRHQIPLESAEKSDKATYLRLMRDDLITKSAFIVDSECEDLEKEWDSLQWKNEDKRDEDPRCQNHCSDSALYAWRKAYHYTYVEPEPPKSINSDAYMDELEKKEAEEMAIRHREKQDEWMNW